MKILIIMDPGILIPVKGYGGHERLVEMFAKAYAKMGHDVHLLITGGSSVEGCTVHDFGKEGFPPKRSDRVPTIREAWRFLRSHAFDLIHNFGRLAYLIPVLRQPVKKIMTYGREITSRNIQFAQRLGGKHIVYTACSQNLLSRVRISGPWEVVYNAIEFAKYTLQEQADPAAALIFLGRIERVKGCHTAIQVALASKSNLVIAGNISPLPEEKAYFEQEILPHIDGKQIRYVGPLDDAQKNDYLGKAKALLFPIEWNEPFGIVMIEAMACGTPVIAYNKGSVDEVVEEGVTGFKVNSLKELIGAAHRVSDINRRTCRERAESRFDVMAIAQRYLSISGGARKKIIIITTGQPAANPRVVKEYEALKERDYDVKVLYTYSADWSYKIDQEKYNANTLPIQDFILVGGNPYTGKIPYFFSRSLFKIFKIIYKVLPLSFLAEMTLARSSLYLWLAAQKQQGDVYIAHYLGALPAAISVAKKNDGAVIFDAEDFHRGEAPYYPQQIEQVIAIENKFLPKTNYITTASPLISAAYQKLYPVKKIITINNVFSRKHLQPARKKKEGLSLFWFSQNIGPNRGLEVIIAAINTLDIPVSLSLLGTIRDPGYVQQLLAETKQGHSFQLLDAVPPEQIFRIAAGFDIGIAAEIPYCENRNLCLTNKIFTYLLAGNCILASNTAAQQDFLQTYSNIGLLYTNDDARDLAEKIQYLYAHRDILEDCQENARHLGDITLNWENEQEKLFRVIDEVALHDPS